MEYENYFIKLKFRESENWEIDMMDFYIKTGCIRDEDLERILGD